MPGRFAPGRLAIALPVLIAWVGWSGGSAAAASDPGPAPAQYVEVVPTSGGSSSSSSAGKQYVEVVPAAGASGAGKPPSTLPKTTQRKIDRVAGRQAPLLKRVATSSAYGAPQRQLPPSPRAESRTAQSPPAAGAQPASAGSAVDAAVEAAASGDIHHLVGLGAALAVITMILLGATVLRSRRRDTVASELDARRR